MTSSFIKRVAIGIITATTVGLVSPAQAASAKMDATPVNETKFAVVGVPIRGSGRSLLQIYEQVGSERACFSKNGSTVDPLLVSFDFTNICRRYVDSNGYSVRIGDRDYTSTYSLNIRKNGNELLLVATPSRPGIGPEMEVARANGNGDEFASLTLNAGWSLRKRSWQGRTLGHLYLYREAFPAGDLAQTEIETNDTSQVRPVQTNTADQPATETREEPVSIPLF
jgi:hypothetical protein